MRLVLLMMCWCFCAEAQELTLSKEIQQSGEKVTAVLKGPLSGSTLVGQVQKSSLGKQTLFQIGWYAVKDQTGQEKYLKTPVLSQVVSPKSRLPKGHVLEASFDTHAFKNLSSKPPEAIHFTQEFVNERRIPESSLSKPLDLPQEAEEKKELLLATIESGDESSHRDQRGLSGSGLELDFQQSNEANGEKDEDVKRCVKCQKEGEPFTVVTTRVITHVGLTEKLQKFLYGRYAHCRYAGTTYYTYNTPVDPSRSWRHFDGINWAYDTYWNEYDYLSRTSLIPLSGKGEPTGITPWAKTSPEDVKRGHEDVGPGHDVWQESQELKPFLESGVVMSEVVHREPLESGVTKTVLGTPITRPFWQEKLTYRCTFEEVNNCHSYEGEGTLKSSRCLKEVGGKCAVYEHEYEIVDYTASIKEMPHAR